MLLLLTPQQLNRFLSSLSGVPASEVDSTAPLTSTMDSMSISQFKAVLENELYVDVSDGYLFRDDCTPAKLVEVVKLGSAPDDDDAGAEGVGVGPPGGDAGPALAPPGLCCAVS